MVCLPTFIKCYICSFIPLLSLIHSHWHLGSSWLSLSLGFWWAGHDSCCWFHLFKDWLLLRRTVLPEQPTHVVLFRNRSSHFRTDHESVLWIISSTHLPRLPTLSPASPPHSSSHPWSTFFSLLMSASGNYRQLIMCDSLSLGQHWTLYCVSLHSFKA